MTFTDSLIYIPLIQFDEYFLKTVFDYLSNKYDYEMVPALTIKYIRRSVCKRSWETV